MVDPLLLGKAGQLLLPGVKPVLTLQGLLLKNKKLKWTEKQLVRVPMYLTKTHQSQYRCSKKIRYESKELEYQMFYFKVQEAYQLLAALQELVVKIGK